MDAKDGPVTLSREELYDLVWSEPTSHLAPKYGMSNVGLAKICRKMRIPVPGRGYWAKLHAGQRVGRRPLPQGRTTDVKGIALRLQSRTKPSDAGVPEHPMAARESDPASRITVSAAVATLHPLAERARRSLRNAQPDEKGLLQPRTARCLDIQVARDSLDRALRVADALLKALDEREFRVDLVKDEIRQTRVEILNEHVQIRLGEKVRQIKRRAKDRWDWPRYEYAPTGVLRLSILSRDALNVRKIWQDGKMQRIEDCLNRFTAGMVKAALAIKEERARRDQRQREWLEAEQRRAEEQQRRWEEEQRVHHLEELAAAWKRSQHLRSFIAHVRDTRGYLPRGIPGESLVEWLRWAEGYVDTVDPLKSATS